MFPQEHSSYSMGGWVWESGCWALPQSFPQTAPNTLPQISGQSKCKSEC